MSVAASWSEIGPLAPPVGRGEAPLQRSRGRARLAFKRREAATVLDEFFQEGCVRLRLPRCHAGWPEAVLLNTAGGLTGGDRVELAVRWGAGTAATVSSQAAEKVYRALAGVARVETRLTVEDGARAEWLPQETILFDRAALRRDLEVRLAGNASFLGLEALVFGRAAMGERLRQGNLRDAWRIWRDGRLLLADALRLEGDLEHRLGQGAVAAGCHAVALLVLAEPDAEHRVPAVRGALADAKGLAGASGWDGLLVARFVAADGATLRGDLLRALAALRDSRPAPRVWQC